jgi:hypothetical protein
MVIELQLLELIVSSVALALVARCYFFAIRESHKRHRSTLLALPTLYLRLTPCTPSTLYSSRIYILVDLGRQFTSRSLYGGLLIYRIKL